MSSTGNLPEGAAKTNQDVVDGLSTISIRSEVVKKIPLRTTAKEIVSGVLGVPNNKAWTITSDNSRITGEEADLVMVNYDPDKADLAVYGPLRGMVVDLELGMKVADSFGYTPIAVADAIAPDVKGNLNLTDINGIRHVIPLKDSTIKYGLEGVLIRVFRWGGQTYKVSHRQFDISRSRWGNSTPFLDIYEKLGGPTGDELFDPDEQYSPFVHFFLASHPDLLHVTKDQIGDGSLYYLGYHQMWVLNDQLPFSFTDANGEIIGNNDKLFVGWINPEPKVPPRIRNTLPSLKERSKGEIISLPDLSVPEANTLLRYGYQVYQDPNYDLRINPRLRTGEFIVIYKPDGTLLTVRSTSYHWRASEIAQDNPNRINQLFLLTSAANQIKDSDRDNNPIKYDLDLKSFRRRFPPMVTYDIQSLKETLKDGPILIWDERNDGQEHFEEILTLDQRIYNVWAALFMAAPISKQNQIIDYYERYIQEREDLINWLVNRREQKKEQAIKWFEELSSLEDSERDLQLTTLENLAEKERLEDLLEKRIIEDNEKFYSWLIRLYDDFLPKEDCDPKDKFCKSRIDVLTEKAERLAISYLARQRGHRRNFEDSFRYYIRNLILIESGSSLYSMIRTMKREK